MNIEERKGGKVAYFIWAIASLFYLYEYFVRVIPSVMEAELQEAFLANATQVAAAVGMYSLIYAPMQLFVGPLFDLCGTRKLLIPAGLLLALSCFLPLIPSNTLLWFGTGRFVMGFSSAFGFVGIMYLCTILFPANRLAMLSGLTTALGMIGAIVCQYSLASVVDSLGWRSTWSLSVWFGLIVAILLWLFIPRQPSWAKPSNKHSLWKTFSKSLWYAVKCKQIWIVGLACGALFTSLSVFADFWGISYIMALTGCTKMSAVNVVAMLYLGWTIGAPLSGWISDAAGSRKTMMVVSSIACCILFTAFLFLNNVSLLFLSVFIFILGLFSGGQVIGFIAGVESTPDFANGSSIAVINMITTVVGGSIQAFIGMAIDFLEKPVNSHSYSIKSYKLAMSSIPILLLIVAFILIIFMKETFVKHGEK